MCHVLEAALNLMPQKSMSVGTLHKAKWHLGQANKLFENEKKKLQQMNIKTISAGHWTLICPANLTRTCDQALLLGCVIYILLDGLTYNTRGYFASCVVFFRAPQGRGKTRATSKYGKMTS